MINDLEKAAGSVGLRLRQWKLGRGLVFGVYTGRDTFLGRVALEGGALVMRGVWEPEDLAALEELQLAFARQLAAPVFNPEFRRA